MDARREVGVSVNGGRIEELEARLLGLIERVSELTALGQDVASLAGRVLALDNEIAVITARIEAVERCVNADADDERIGVVSVITLMNDNAVLSIDFTGDAGPERLEYPIAFADIKAYLDGYNEENIHAFVGKKARLERLISNDGESPWLFMGFVREVRVNADDEAE